jgi:hypothetical protein
LCWKAYEAVANGVTVIVAVEATEPVPAATDWDLIVPATPTIVPADKPVSASTVEADETNETVLVATAVTV